MAASRSTAASTGCWWSRSRCPRASAPAACRSSSSTARATDLPSVHIDDEAGGRLAAEHLLGLGHTRIAFIGDTEENPYGFDSSARRRRGYEAALRDAGVAIDPALVRSGPHGRDAARALARDLLGSSAPPSAIFAASDDQALGVLEAAESASVSVPDRLSVVGFDDLEVARYAHLTTVAQPLEASGARGVDLLLDALAGEIAALGATGLRARGARHDRARRARRWRTNVGESPMCERRCSMA